MYLTAKMVCKNQLHKKDYLVGVVSLHNTWIVCCILQGFR